MPPFEIRTAVPACTASRTVQTCAIVAGGTGDRLFERLGAAHPEDQGTHVMDAQIVQVLAVIEFDVDASITQEADVLIALHHPTRGAEDIADARAAVDQAAQRVRALQDTAIDDLLS